MIPFSGQPQQSDPATVPAEPGQDSYQPGQPIAMTQDQLGIWMGRIERARARRKLVEDEWQKNLDAYQGVPLSERPSKDWVNPNTDFADVEQKKAQLFFTTPEVHCIPKEPIGVPLTNVILIKQAVLNDKLGPNGVDAKRLIDKVTFDALCPAGWGATKIGYEVTTRPVPHPTLTDETGQPQSVDVPVYEEYFWEHFSPKKLLIPDDFFDNEYDRAPWIAMEFALPFLVAQRKYKLPDDFAGTASSDENVFDQRDGSGRSSGDTRGNQIVTGVEIWYKAALEDPACWHPEWLRVLVLIDGLSDRPARHTEGIYQTLTAEGRLTADSMIGYPIHVLTLRDVTDSAYIRSDCSMTRDLVDQLSKFLTQQVQQRDTSIPMRLVDEGIITPDVMTKIQNGDYGSFIPIPPGGLNPPPVVEIARAQYPRENFEAQNRIERQLAKTLALDSNQQGVNAETARTATELSIVQNNASVRLKAERNRVVSFFIAGVQKFDTLLQRFATDTDVVEIVGPDGARQWATWNKETIAGRYAYQIKPDSGVDIDEATARKQALDTYNYLGKDPLVNRAYLLQELAPALHLDPQQLKAPPPPPAPPEKPNVSFAFKGEDLLNPLAVAVMVQGGIMITPQMIQAADLLIRTATGAPPIPQQMSPGLPGLPLGTPPPPQPAALQMPMGPPRPPSGPAGAPPTPPHPGAMEKTPLINQHAADETGRISGAPNLPQRVQ